MPCTFVEIGENSPRISVGASGFMSHMSSWLGPPRIQRMMTGGRKDSWQTFRGGREPSCGADGAYRTVICGHPQLSARSIDSKVAT
jgi:hypothetical protein